METLNAVDKETLERIGQAYLICSKYPEVFGGVTLEKLCSLFVDELDEDEREARMRKYAPGMYDLLKEVLNSNVINSESELGEWLEDSIYASLRVIDGTEDEDEEEDEHEARMRKYAPEMYRVLKDIRTWGEEKEINNEQEDRLLYEEICAVLNEIDGEEDEK